MTGNTQARNFLSRAPCTGLSLIHPCLANTLLAKAEMKVGSTVLRNIEKAQKVLVNNHHPDTRSKQRRAKILARLGPHIKTHQ